MPKRTEKMPVSQGEQPFARNVTTETDGGGDFENARDDSPDSD